MSRKNPWAATYPELRCAMVDDCDRVVVHSAHYKDRSHYKGPGVPCCRVHYNRWHRGIDLADRQPPERTHGKISTYQDAKCRCPECRAVSRRKRQEYRDRQRTEGPHGCRYCPARFPTTTALYLHENHHEKEINNAA